MGLFVDSFLVLHIRNNYHITFPRPLLTTDRHGGIFTKTTIQQMLSKFDIIRGRPGRENVGDRISQQLVFQQL